MHKFVNSGLFVTVILLFFLPFMEIRCNDEAFIHASGMAMAFELPFEVNDSMMSGYMQGNEELNNAMSDSKRKPDVFGLIVLFISVIGVAFQFIPVLNKPWMTSLIGGLALLSLLAMYFFYNKGWEKQMSGGNEMLRYFKFTLHFVYGYWLALITTLLIFGFNVYRQIQERRNAYIAPYVGEASPDVTDEV